MEIGERAASRSLRGTRSKISKLCEGAGERAPLSPRTSLDSIIQPVALPMILCLFLTSLTLPLLGTPATESHRLLFHPAEGTVIQKSFSSRVSLSANGFTVEMGGEPVPSAFLPQLVIETARGIDVSVRDHYEAANAKRPTAIVRQYETLAGDGKLFFEAAPSEPEVSSWDAAHELEGEKVAFHWNETAQEYDREWLGRKEQPDMLDQLDARLDLVGFVSDEEVVAGDSWDLDPMVIRKLMLPAGDLGLGLSDETDLSAVKLKDVSGDLSVTLVRMTEVDGVRVAVLSIEGEYKQEEVEATDLSRVPVADGSATETTVTSLDVEGELQWNMDANQAFTLELNAVLESVSETVRDPDQGGATYSSKMNFSGKVTIEVSFETVSE
ncbi:MAG: hypothetical protein ACI9F9_001237 [Candidatus Paceibacteria bacterium]|jgi:hypothetical protein